MRPDMEEGLFRFIWTRSRRRQIIALALTLGSLPLLYLSLELPKAIINEAIGGDEWPRQLLSRSIDQLPYLLLLCLAFISLVAINAFIRHRVNVLKAQISVRLLSQLRFELMERVLRFPLSQFKRVSPGEISSMVMSEVAPFGRFFGDSIAVPVFEGAMFGTILIFMFMQDLYLGLAASALVPFQAYLVPRLQRTVNVLTETIVMRERELSTQITEVVDGVQEVHAQDGSAHVLEKIRRRLGRVTVDRLEASTRASFLKLCTTLLGHLTPFSFYLVGGWLVIRGDLSFGALVAALAAHRNLAEPWTDLLDYYRDLAEARTKFDVVVRQFNPANIWPAILRESPPGEVPHLTGPIEAVGVGYVDENGWRVLDDVNLRFEHGQKIVIQSSLGSSRDVAASIFSRLYLPTVGSLRFSGVEASEIHQTTAGTRIALLDSQPAFFDSTVGENLYLALSTPPNVGRTSDWSLEQSSGRSGASSRPDAPNHPWVNPHLAGLPDRQALRKRTLELFYQLELDADLYSLGLNQHPELGQNPGFEEEIVEARAEVLENLARLHLDDLIQPFDPYRFNNYSTLGENILFGEADDVSIASDRLAESTTVRRLLRESNLDEAFFDIGLRCGSILLEILSGLPKGHAFFEQYSLVSEADLPKLAEIVNQVEQSGERSLSDRQRSRIMRLTFGLAPQRHRFGLIDDDLKASVLELRRLLRHYHPEIVKDLVSPYDVDQYNWRLSILSNLIFGKIMFGRAHAEARVIHVVDEVVERRGLRDQLLIQALEAPAGVGGRRLSASVRQKLGIARSLLKRPDLVVVNDMLNALDGAARARLTERIFEQTRDATLIWLDTSLPPGIVFDRRYRIDGAHLHEPESGTGGRSGRVDTPVPRLEDPLLEEAAALRNVPLLASLDSARLKLLAFTGERLEYSPGDILFRQGDEGEEAYVILAGNADIVVERELNRVVLYSLGPGQMIGELAMLCDTPRSATARAKTRLTALRLNREVFFETMRQDPAFSFKVARDLGERLVRTTEEISLPGQSE